MKTKRLTTIFTIFALFFFLGKASAAPRQKQSLKISGFVDTAYFENRDRDSSLFKLKEVELDIEKAIGNVGALRTDLNFIITEDNPNTAYDESELSADDILEQGYIDMRNGSDYILRMGKFNAPIGFEAQDAPDMLQYSHSSLYDYSLPKNLTGLDIIADYGYMNIDIYMVNGWDERNDANNKKSTGGRIRFKPADGFMLDYSYITGDESVEGYTDAEPLTITDLVIVYSMSPDTILVLEQIYGTHQDKSVAIAGDDAKWNARLILLRFKTSSNSGFTCRYDLFNDEEGSRLDRPAVTAGLITNRSEIRKSYTVAKTFDIGNGLGWLIEYKRVVSNENVFVNKFGEAVDNDATLAVEFKYQF